MMNRTFWGTPHTETDMNAFEAALLHRAPAVAAGQFSAAVAADDLLERVVRRSGALLQADAVFSIVALLFIYKSSTDGLATVLLLNRWSFGLAVAACVLLLTNLGPSWARKVGETYADPREAFSFTMDSYRRRAWRFTVSLWLSIAAFVLMLVAVWQLP